MNVVIFYSILLRNFTEILLNAFFDVKNQREQSAPADQCDNSKITYYR
ncbi:hypothetical protein PEC301619_04450 [Pectobacterium carotovorum subsp. carotovorum]|nr:hypothetical protein PEC301619_04450 [Pectobacterium carotovorum subsp. carotovorum]